MLPPEAASPIEALNIVTGKIKQGSIDKIDLETADGHYLAEELAGPPAEGAFPFDPAKACRSSCDGFALPPGTGLHDELELIGQVSQPAGEAAPLPEAGFACRLNAVPSWLKEPGPSCRRDMQPSLIPAESGSNTCRLPAMEYLAKETGQEEPTAAAASSPRDWSPRCWRPASTRSVYIPVQK